MLHGLGYCGKRLTLVLHRQESAELVRTLPESFKSLISPEKAKIDLYPSHLRSQINEIEEWMQSDLNAGVYKAGFAPSQEVYDKNMPRVFVALNKLENTISENGGPYILGKDLTELDIRAYTTIVRFDVSCSVRSADRIHCV